MLADVGLHHVRDLVGSKLLALVLLLGRGVAALQPGGQDLLGLGAGGVKGHAPVRADGVLAQGRAGASGSVEDDEDLLAPGRDLELAPGRDLEAETRQGVIPEHGPLGGMASASMLLLRRRMRGKGRSRLLPKRAIGSSREASGGLSVNADPEVG